MNRDRGSEETDELPGGDTESSIMDGTTETGITDEIVLTADGEVVASFSSGTQADTMAKAVKLLADEYDLLDYVSFPYVPGSRKVILNKTPKNLEGEEMRQHRRISDSCCLNTHLGKNQKERYLRRLAEKCDLSVEFNW